MLTHHNTQDSPQCQPTTMPTHHNATNNETGHNTNPLQCQPAPPMTRPTPMLPHHMHKTCCNATMMKVTTTTLVKMMTAITMGQGTMVAGMVAAGVVMGVGLPVHILIYSNKIIFCILQTM